MENAATIETNSSTASGGTEMARQKSIEERVVQAVGKRPKTATEIGQKLGYSSHLPVSRAINKAVSAGTIQKTDRGYTKP
jgi:hypothetical protein